MKRIAVTLRLHEPLVISATNATEGLYRSLDFIPGSALLGAVAAQLYRDFKRTGQAEAVFHSGRVRFANILPKGAQPVPLSLYRPKEEGEAAGAVFNLLHGRSEDSTVQLKQLREGYVQPAGEGRFVRIQPKRQLKLRTAIESETGRAAESQLYSYQAISPEWDWSGHIDCDDDALADVLYERLSRIGTLRIGRSRSAHYGTVTLQVTPPQTVSEDRLPLVTLDGQAYLLLWLTSDLMVYDRYGRPDTLPSLQALGLLEGGEARLPQQFFVRTRRYAPYNAYRGCYDLNRQVITAGSVLAYPVTDAVRNLNPVVLSRALGAHREQGLGQVATAEEVARLLSQPTLKLLDQVPDDRSSSTRQAQQDMPVLIRWLKQRHGARICRNELERWMMQHLYEEVRSLYRAAYRQALVPPYGPGPTQWNRLRNFAEQNRHGAMSLDALFEALRQPGEAWHRAEINPNTQDRAGSVQDGWQVMTRSDRTFADAFAQLLREKYDLIDQACRGDALLVLRTVAHRLAADPQIRRLAEEGDRP